MSEQSDTPSREPGAFEYPDEAGYPDGTGVLDEGTASEPDLEELDDFADSDAEDVEDV